MRKYVAKLISVLINEERIFTYYVDQSGVDSLRNLIAVTNREFDLIIDDGSHILEHQLLSFSILSEAVRVGGYYIVEDIKRRDLDEFINIPVVDFIIEKVHKGFYSWDSFIVYKKLSSYTDA